MINCCVKSLSLGMGGLSAIDNSYRNKTQTCRHPLKWQMVSLLWCSKICRWFIKSSSHDLFTYSTPIWSQSCFLLNVILKEPHSKDNHLKGYHLKISAPLLFKGVKALHWLIEIILVYCLQRFLHHFASYAINMLDNFYTQAPFMPLRSPPNPSLWAPKVAYSF